MTALIYDLDEYRKRKAMAGKPKLVVIIEGADSVETWRYQEFKRMGFEPIVAEALTLDRSVDLHVAERLLDSGCSLEKAREILL